VVVLTFCGFENSIGCPSGTEYLGRFISFSYCTPVVRFSIIKIFSKKIGIFSSVKRGTPNTKEKRHVLITIYFLGQHLEESCMK
jgi:hypothetical protein